MVARVRAISLDVTGTLLVHAKSVSKSYVEVAHWAGLSNIETSSFSSSFKKSFKQNCEMYPCYGSGTLNSSKKWWELTARNALEDLGYGNIPPDVFNRFFRRIYQYYGSPAAYALLPDAMHFLDWARSKNYIVGITSNTPSRSMNTVLPMLGIHEQLSWFVCSEEVGHEKPSRQIFDATYMEATCLIPNLQRDEVLHVGDSLAADYCGARAAGFQALLLDRSANPRATAFQQWLPCLQYEGMSESDVAAHTVTSFHQVIEYITSTSNDISS